MKLKRIVRVILIFSIVIFFAYFTLYNYASGIFFNKAISLNNSGKVKTASLAYQIVFTKYPFSVFSPISRINYGNLAVKGKIQISKTNKSAIKEGAFYYSDGFTLFCILFYGLLSTIFTLLGENQTNLKKLFWKRLGTFLGLLILYGLWSGFSSTQISTAKSPTTYLLFAISFGLWSIAGIVLVFRSFIIVSQSMISQSEGPRSNFLVIYSNSKRVFYPFLVYIFVFGLTLYLIAEANNFLPTQNQEKTQSKSIYIVNSSNGLNLRLGPGTNYKVKRVLKNREKVELIRARDNWAYIRLDNTQGWVFAKYLKKQ